MISVVIPAHDEARVIDRCLASLCADARPDELDVVVVCNGCSDETAERARAHGAPVRVIEIEEASKIAALNRGDGEARGFPRFYLDADIALPIEAVRTVARALEEGPLLAASPRLRVDLSQRGYGVRAFYEVWQEMPYLAQGAIGSGVYAVSEAGRARFGAFPDIIADDGYVRLHFAPHERDGVDGCSFTLTPPRTLLGLVEIKTRTHKGNLQLARRFPELARNEHKPVGPALRRMLARPAFWPKLVIYYAVMASAKLLARRRLARGDLRWERSDDSREATS